MSSLAPRPEEKEDEVEEDLQRKFEKLEEDLRDERRRAETYLNQLKYARADLENLQKQMQRRIDEAVDRETRRLLMQLLTIAEELDLAVEAARRTKNDAVLKGVEMVRGKLSKMLDSEGVSPIEAEGKLFDPNLHEAVLEVESGTSPEGTILEELRRGYLYKGRVLKASMVKVARNPSSKDVKEVNEDG